MCLCPFWFLLSSLCVPLRVFLSFSVSPFLSLLFFSLCVSFVSVSLRISVHFYLFLPAVYVSLCVSVSVILVSALFFSVCLNMCVYLRLFVFLSGCLCAFVSAIFLSVSLRLCRSVSSLVSPYPLISPIAPP